MSESEQWPAHYGDSFVGGELATRGTIHDSGVIDIQVDPQTHEVRAVWFRCLELPFRVSELPAADEEPGQPAIAITAVEYLPADAGEAGQAAG